jgi:hypothetical protein
MDIGDRLSEKRVVLYQDAEKAASTTERGA